MGQQNNVSFSVEDFNGEKSRMSINTGPITLLNFTAYHDAIDDLATTMAVICAGELRNVAITENFPKSPAAITDQNAQRESKFLVTYRDITPWLDGGNTIANTGYLNLYSVELPAADLSYLLPNSDLVDLADADVAAFVAAFEAINNSPTGGNEIEVVTIRHVGRNI